MLRTFLFSSSNMKLEHCWNYEFTFSLKMGLFNSGSSVVNSYAHHANVSAKLLTNKKYPTISWIRRTQRIIFFTI